VAVTWLEHEAEAEADETVDFDRHDRLAQAVLATAEFQFID
jgi:hypothetical protein